MSALSNKLREAAARARGNQAVAPTLRRMMYGDFAELFTEAANRIDVLEKPEEKNGEVCA